MSGPISPRDPPGFYPIAGSDGLAWARPEAMDWGRDALEAEGTLYAAARRESGGATSLLGRAPVFVVRRGSSAWAVRRYTRGGAMASLLGDRYLRFGPTRPRMELAASRALRERGIPTPEIVAFATYEAGAFYRADLVTELVPDAMDLAEFLFLSTGDTPSDDRRSEVLRASGELVRRLAEAGGYHRDLNAKNLLVPRHDSGRAIFLLDLDGCRVTDGPNAQSLSRMDHRLRHSLVKWGKKTGRGLEESDWNALQAGLESPSSGTNRPASG